MHSLIPLIKKIAQRIAEAEAQRKRLADFVRALPGMGLTSRVEPDPLQELKVAGVDGGIVKRSFHGMDCMLVRAAGVCFHYREGKVQKVDYYPSRNPTPRPEMYEALSELDWNHFCSLARLREESRTALETLEHLQPDILLLDGMILPHYLDRPGKYSPLYPAYKEVLSSYQALLRKAASTHTALAGVVEDSRNIAFCTHLETVLSRIPHPPELGELLSKSRDSNLLFFMLKKGERSLSFPVTSPVTQDLDFPPLQTFYLKTAEFDRPIRVDYLPETTRVDALAGILLSISGHHSGYGFPTPLIEADQVARLTEEEMETLYSQILSLTGGLPSIMKMRREQRPF